MSSELRVEGEKVYDAQGNPKGVRCRPLPFPLPDQLGLPRVSCSDLKDYTRVQAGYKAASHNPSLTEETREGAESTLQDLQAQHDSGASSSSKPKTSTSTSSAPKTASGAEEYVDDEEDTTTSSHEQSVHHSRIVGGLKANLHRDDRSEETKDEIRKKLADMGEEAE
ncbi:hypothetical protein JCM11251_006922 [Rhodosporidiobolus azoricus]